MLQRVRANDLAYILELKPGDPQLEMSNQFQGKPLLAALAMRQMDMVKALLDKGASVKPEKNQTDPMEAAIRTRNVEIVRLMLSHGASTERVGFGFFPIHIAAEVGNVEIIEEGSCSFGPLVIEGSLVAPLIESVGVVLSVGSLVVESRPITA